MWKSRARHGRRRIILQGAAAGQVHTSRTPEHAWKWIWRMLEGRVGLGWGGGLLIWGTFQTLVRTPAVGPSVLRSGSLKLGAGSGRQ